MKKGTASITGKRGKKLTCQPGTGKETEDGAKKSKRTKNKKKRKRNAIKLLTKPII